MHQFQRLADIHRLVADSFQLRGHVGAHKHVTQVPRDGAVDRQHPNRLVVDVGLHLIHTRFQLADLRVDIPAAVFDGRRHQIDHLLRQIRHVAQASLHIGKFVVKLLHRTRPLA